MSALRIDVFTVFPGLISNFADESLLGRAQERSLLEVNAHDLRMATTDNHKTVDDAPFGGGAGMVLMPEPVFGAVEQIDPPRPVLLMSPSGETFDQEMALRLAESDGFSLLCGRYEGVDERIASELCDGAVSIGDYVLAGGEVAALVMIEAVARLVPGVMGNDDSAADESFMTGLLEYPHFTRPADFRGLEVPAVLRSGDHGKVERWRRAQALARTIERRPDLIEARGGLSAADQKALDEFGLGT
jgi:tRNA (guanine37-N1)-methyltransferase